MVYVSHQADDNCVIGDCKKNYTECLDKNAFFWLGYRRQKKW